MPINGLTINQEKELRRRRQAQAPQVADPKIHTELRNLYELVSQYRKMQKAGGTVSAAIKHDQLKYIDECLRELRPFFYQKL